MQTDNVAASYNDRNHCELALHMSKIPLHEGRRLFGSDPVSYANARLDYPDELYKKVSSRCGLRPGVAVFEVGAGTGLATKRLLSLGACPLRAIEPDPRLAAFLRRTLQVPALQIDESSFEEAEFHAAGFDIGIAATSFHWLEQASALKKVHGALKPGGWWAMWWTHFGSGERDAFQIATAHLFVDTSDTPSLAGKRGLPFALDRERRLEDLLTAGFRDAEAEMWRSSHPYETARLVDLYSTFSPVQSLEPERRRQLLHEIARIADEQFGGCVERRFITVLYTARRP